MNKQTEKSRYQNVYRIILALISIFPCLSNFIWLNIDTRPPAWDQAGHLNTSLSYFNIISNLSFNSSTELLEATNFYPPLFYIAAFPFYKIFGLSADSGTLTSSFFMVILILATFGIGKKIYNVETGLLSAFAVSQFNVVVHLSRQYMADIPMAAMVACSIYFLIKSENFQNRKYSLIAGISCGFGMLTRWNFAFFFLFPFLFEAAKCAMDQKQRAIKFGNLLIFILLILFICTPWYFSNLIPIISDSKRSLVDVALMEGDPHGFNIENISYYLKALYLQTNILWFVLFLAGILSLCFNFFKKKLGKEKILLWWFWGSYLIITAITNKDIFRFSLGYISAVAVISTYFLIRIKNIKLKRGIISSVIILSLVTSISNSYGLKILPFLYEPDPPLKEEWQIDSMLNSIREDGISYNDSINVRIIPDHPRVQRAGFEFHSNLNKLNLKFSRWSNFPNFTDYIITKDGDIGPFFSVEARELSDYINNSPPAFANVFKPMKEIALPDGSKSVIYKRSIAPLNNYSAHQVNKIISDKLMKLLSDYVKNPKGLKFYIKEFDSENTKRGRFKSLIIKAASGVVGDYRHKDLGLYVTNLSFEFKDITINLHRLIRDNKIEVISLKEIIPSGKITEKELEKYLQGQVKDLKEVRVKFENGFISLSGKTKKWDIGIALSAKPIFSEKGNLDIEVDTLKIGFLKLPATVTNYALRNFHLFRQVQTPCKVNIRSLNALDGTFGINSI